MKIPGILSKGELARNIAVLTGGTVIAALINLAISPVHSRIFDESDYAVFGVFTSIITFFLVFANLRLEQAIPLPGNDDEAKSIAKYGLKIALIISAVCGIFTGLFHLIRHAQGKEFNLLIYLCVPTILVMGTVQVLNFYSIRKKTFEHNSAGRIIGATCSGLLSALLGFLVIGPLGLIVGFFLGQMAIMFWMWSKYLPEIVHHVYGEHDWSYIRKKYRTLIVINSIHAVVDTFELSGVIFVLEYYFPGGAEVGLFFFSYRILKMPLNMVGAALYQVLYQKMSEATREKQNIRPFIRKIYFQLFLLGILPFGFIFFYGGELFSILFGDRWFAAGIVSAILVPWMFSNFISSPFSSLALIFSKQQYSFVIAVIGTTLRLGGCVIGGMQNDFTLAMMLLSAVSCAQMLFLLFWYHYIARY